MTALSFWWLGRCQAGRQATLDGLINLITKGDHPIVSQGLLRTLGPSQKLESAGWASKAAPNGQVYPAAMWVVCPVLAKRQPWNSVRSLGRFISRVRLLPSCVFMG